MPVTSQVGDKLSFRDCCQQKRPAPSWSSGTGSPFLRCCIVLHLWQAARGPPVSRWQGMGYRVQLRAFFVGNRRINRFYYIRPGDRLFYSVQSVQLDARACAGLFIGVRLCSVQIGCTWSAYAAGFFLLVRKVRILTRSPPLLCLCYPASVIRCRRPFL